MAKRNRARREDPEIEQAESQEVEGDAWDTPEFRRSVLLGLIFVTAPAVVMVALGEHAIAAAWFGVGVLVIILESRHQVRSLWRSLGSRRRPD